MIPAIFLWLGINAVQAQTRLSIEDCRRMALENSDDIKISSRKVGKAVSDRQAAKTAYFPKISGSATYAYIFENIDMGMVGMEMSMKGMYMAGITLQQPVYAGGKIVNANKMAKTGVANLGRKQKAYPNQYTGRGGADVLDVCFGSGKGKTAYTIYSIVGFVASAGQQFF